MLLPFSQTLRQSIQKLAYPLLRPGLSWVLSSFSLFRYKPCFLQLAQNSPYCHQQGILSGNLHTVCFRVLQLPHIIHNIRWNSTPVAIDLGLLYDNASLPYRTSCFFSFVTSLLRFFLLPLHSSLCFEEVLNATILRKSRSFSAHE